ncbi:ATP/GTP-binding protein [Streptomyces longispororuber]|uniref:ATP/GTP-binding protein n=1 Tax=Streptomyces longispororuber TaxID=68230 RepID=A0A918ZD32_9ACTN|nr:AarF/UbiB family protein [Streptomyces longispororuber]GHE43742.1 ATP/GTP-binding protein [Streptomyces longispororuber]
MSAARARLLAHVAKALLMREVSETPLAWRHRRTDDSSEAKMHRRAVAVREAFEQLGPFYIKIGQILSTREDIVPSAIARELEHLHDRASVMPFTHMEPVLEAALGRGWRRMFRSFDTRSPLGAASLAQVYAARLDNGQPVAVKVQRPRIRYVVEEDMKMLQRAARRFAAHAPRFNATIDTQAMLGVVLDAMRPELDFVLEARNMDRARTAARSFELVDVPDVLDATPTVLVQSMAAGTNIRDADPTAFKPDERSAIGRDILAYMYRGYFVDMTFHADPHPGNIFVAPGEPASLIDWGMVGHIDRRLSMSLMLILLSLSRNDGTALSKAWIEMGKLTPWADVSAFTQDMTALVPKIATASLEELNFGTTLTQVLSHSTRRGIQTSPMVSILGKSFANTDGSVRYLAPELSVTEVFQDQMRTILFEYARQALSEDQAARTAMELLIAAQSAPGELRGLLRDLANHELTVQFSQVQKQNFFPYQDRIDSRAKRALRTVLAFAALGWWRAEHLYRKTHPSI